VKINTKTEYIILLFVRADIGAMFGRKRGRSDKKYAEI